MDVVGRLNRPARLWSSTRPETLTVGRREYSDRLSESLAKR